MNRGRHCSRKPVEGQTGNSASANTSATTTSAKLMNIKEGRYEYKNIVDDEWICSEFHLIVLRGAIPFSCHFVLPMSFVIPTKVFQKQLLDLTGSHLSILDGRECGAYVKNSFENMYFCLWLLHSFCFEHLLL